MKIVIIGTGNRGINLARALGPVIEKKVFELKRCDVPDMNEVIDMVKRSKTTQHKALMRKGRNEFRKRGKF